MKECCRIEVRKYMERCDAYVNRIGKLQKVIQEQGEMIEAQAAAVRDKVRIIREKFNPTKFSQMDGNVLKVCMDILVRTGEPFTSEQVEQEYHRRFHTTAADTVKRKVRQLAQDGQLIRVGKGLYSVPDSLVADD